MKLIPLIVLVTLVCATGSALAQEAEEPRKPHLFEPLGRKELTKIKKEDRKGLLGIKRIKSRRGTLQEVVSSLSKEFGVIPVYGAKIDLKRTVNLRGGNKTFGKCLSSIGLRREGSTIYEIPDGAFTGNSRTVQFFSNTKPWAGEFEGTIFHTVSDFNDEGAAKLCQVLDWKLSGRIGKEVIPFESCKWHSPEKHMLRLGKGFPDTLKVDGTLWWSYQVLLTAKTFVDGDFIRVGKYDMRIRWPIIEMNLPEPVPAKFRFRMLSLKGKLKAGIVEKKSSGGLGFGGGASGSIRPKRSDWCGCPGPCDSGDPLPVKLMPKDTHIMAASGLGSRGHKLSDMEEIYIELRVPVKEKIKATLKPYKKPRTKGAK